MSKKVWASDKERKIHNQRRYELKRKFGITYDDYLHMMELQKHKCAICSSSEPGGKGNWHVDHDHSLGSVSALLCFSCNVGLGMFKDDTSLLLKARDYLILHKQKD